MSCKMELNERLIITGFRFTCLGLFLVSAVTISWQSLIAFCALLASITLLKPRTQKNETTRTTFMTPEELAKSNPLKGKPKISTLNDLSTEEHNELQLTVARKLLYDAENTESLLRFEGIKHNTQCIFAKKSRVWGSDNWYDNLSLEENISRLVPSFVQFTSACTKLGLDAFLVELPGEEYGTDTATFGAAFWRVLKTISDHDPMKRFCMDSKSIDKKGWVFEFDKCTFFVTSFAPFYPATSPRYGFGAKDCYILFQPEISFAQHNIPIDTTETNWDNPKTVRDKIRVGFKEAGRPYKIRDTVFYPMCEDMVKPLHETDEMVKWWISNDKLKSE